jgi:hypothetical protein
MGVTYTTTSAATYDKIATTTLSSAAASITFSSIAASWTDLRLVLTFTAAGAGQDTYMRFNGDSATNYSGTCIDGNGTSAFSAQYTTTAQQIISFQRTYTSTTVPMLITTDIFSYAGSTYKTNLSTTSSDTNGAGNVGRNVGLWRSTAAITSIVLLISGATNFSIGTTATLYGLKAA